jgi:hypothetical protein
MHMKSSFIGQDTAYKHHIGSITDFFCQRVEISLLFIIIKRITLFILLLQVGKVL